MQIARSANVPVVLDAGGAETPIPQELLKCVTVLTTNSLELTHQTGLPAKTMEQVIQAAGKIHQLVLL